VHLFESSWKKPYSTRGVRAMLSRYAAAGLTHPISPHQLRHFLFTWLKTQGASTTLSSSPTADTRADSPSRSHAMEQ
jgi:integrase/recombinase XerD